MTKESKLPSSKEELLPSQTPLENIENLILNIRGKQVMLDRDLARLYGVETKRLNEAVKRNIAGSPCSWRILLLIAESSARPSAEGL